MKNWIKARMGEILARTSGATVVLDPDGVLDEQAITSVAEACRVARVDDWVGLRRVWDLDIRRVSDGPPTLVCVASAEFATAVDLPWDIEHEADEVIRLRWPVPIELRALLGAADPTSAEKLISAAAKHPDVADIVASAYGVAFGEPGPELDGVVRLRLVPETPEELWDVLAGILTTPAAHSVAVGRGDLAGLQRIWDDWLRHGHSDGADALAAAPGAVLGLLGAGLLKPAPIRAAGLPDWAQVGAVDPDPEQLIAELLARTTCPSYRPGRGGLTLRRGGGRSGPPSLRPPTLRATPRPPGKPGNDSTIGFVPGCATPTARRYSPPHRSPHCTKSPHGWHAASRREPRSSSSSLMVLALPNGTRYVGPPASLFSTPPGVWQ